jgi:hypothetical protein
VRRLLVTAKVFLISLILVTLTRGYVLPKHRFI